MSSLFTCALIVLLLVHCYTDLRWQLLYDRVNGCLGLLGLAYAFWAGELLAGVQGAAVGGGLLLLLYVLSGGGMGLGDVKLALVLGLWLGPSRTLLALLLAFVAGGLVGVFLLTSGLRSRKEAIPFGPFLALGACVSYLWGGSIITWYVQCW